MSDRRRPRVAIIGAGLGGVAMAVQLERAGLTDFVVLEAAAGPGGVWWANTYPGCEVDVESHAYSYSFMPYAWSRTHARQAEVQRYVEAVIDRFDIRDRFRFNCTVEKAVWDTRAGSYTVTLADGQTSTYDVVITALGLLSNPRMPDWPGLQEFSGPVFHTSRYDHGVDLTGKRVAVVGTGSTACQLAPTIAPTVAHLDLYQREPGWVMPKGARDFEPQEQQRFGQSTLARRRARFDSFQVARKNLKGFRADSDHQEKVRGYGLYCLKKVHDTDTRKALTPSYAWGCKRPILADGYYEMFNRDNVSLIPSPVATVTATGLIDATGTERPADALILATGFQATNFLGTIDVVGEHGRRLADCWAGEPAAFLGITVPDFPNLFMMYGPNTNGGWSVIVQLERQASAIARGIKKIWKRKTPSVIVTRSELAQRYDRLVQRLVTRRLSVLSTGCSNYYTSASGKNVTQWPGTHTEYMIATRLLAPLGWRVRAKADRSAGTDQAVAGGTVRSLPSRS